MPIEAMSTSTAHYWFHVSGENLGPLSVEQTRQAARTGRITIDTWAWYDGLEAWQPARDLPALLNAVPELSGDSGGAAAQSEASAIAPYDERLADFGHRLMAGLIDILFLGIVSVGALQISGDLQPILAGGGSDPQLYPFWLNGIYAAYYLFFMSGAGGGRTLGYRTMHLHLADQRSGKPLDLIGVVIWYVGTWVLFVGWLWYFADGRRRMIHNILSRSVVLHDPD